MGKEGACNTAHTGDAGSSPEDLWRREWQPTPVFLPGEFHGQRKLAGYSPCGHKELDTAERLTHTHAYIQMRLLKNSPFSARLNLVLKE